MKTDTQIHVYAQINYRKLSSIYFPVKRLHREVKVRRSLASNAEGKKYRYPGYDDGRKNQAALRLVVDNRRNKSTSCPTLRAKKLDTGIVTKRVFW